MAKFYGLKIRNGEIHIQDVPKLWRSVTADWLNRNGWGKGKNDDSIF